MFRDDFYSTKPSHKRFGKKSRTSGASMRWALVLLAIGLVLIIAVSIQNADDRSVASDAANVSDMNSDRKAGTGKANGGDADGSGKQHDAGGPKSVEAGGSPTEIVSEDGVVYRSDIAAATAKVYEAVVSVVQPSDERYADWDDVYALGSGIIFRIVDDHALVVTNHHVVAASPELVIVLSNGEKKEAELVGSDAISDLAVLKIDAEGITKVAKFGRSSDLQIGEKAIAIGNPLGLGYAHTITQGIVSSTQRRIPVSLSGTGSLDWEMEVIQTDAAINSGNSGGALINIYGEVIGINTMKIAWFGVEGLGFAIPIDLAVPVVEELIERGYVRRPYIGIGAVNLGDYNGEEELNLPDEVTGGAVVVTVDGPAKDAGLREYDVIVKLDDKPVKNMIDVRKYLYTEKKIGDPIKVTVYRKGRERTYRFELGEMPR